jgi:hypothetical protein
VTSVSYACNSPAGCVGGETPGPLPLLPDFSLLSNHYGSGSYGTFDEAPPYGVGGDCPKKPGKAQNCALNGVAWDTPFDSCGVARSRRAPRPPRRGRPIPVSSCFLRRWKVR